MRPGLLLAAALTLYSARAAAPAPAPAGAARTEILRIFKDIDAAFREQEHAGPERSAAIERRVRAFKSLVLKWGPAGAPVLGEIALDKKRTRKTRLWALSFASLTGDAAAFAPLETILLDREAHPDLRQAAASYMAALPAAAASAGSLRRSLCAPLSEENLPRALILELSHHAGRRGCDDGPALDARVRAFGHRPSGLDGRAVRDLISALGKSADEQAPTLLVGLLDNYPSLSPQRVAVLRALLARPEPPPAGAASALRKALSDDRKSKPASLLGIRLLSLMRDDLSVELFIQELAHPEPEVAMEAAKALAAMGAKKGVEPIEELLYRVNADPRFAPAPGREPADLVNQIQSALTALKAAP